MKFPQLREKVLELPEKLRKELFEDILRSIHPDHREEMIPDDICPTCLQNKTHGTCWYCYESYYDDRDYDDRD